jgi:hypothetical protein
MSLPSPFPKFAAATPSVRNFKDKLLVGPMWRSIGQLAWHDFLITHGDYLYDRKFMLAWWSGFALTVVPHALQHLQTYTVQK